MAVTTQNLFEALRIGEGSDIPASILTILERHKATAETLVESYAPNAPEAIKDEAAIRIAAWLFDAPPVQSVTRSPLITSGAASLLTRYRERRAKRVS